MPETRSDCIEIQVDDHWTMDDKARVQIARLAKELAVDLTEPDTMSAVFGVERLREYPGDLDNAMRRMRDWAIEREVALIDHLHTREADHHEAQTIAWTYLIAPDGTQINVTAREGATADSVAATVLALTGGARILGELGFTTQKQQRR